MLKELEELRRLLMEGQRLSKQGSYERRAPAKEAAPLLQAARKALKDYVSRFPADASAWHMLSQTEECLLNYGAARISLERAMELAGSRDKKDLKKLALLKEYEARWARLSLSPDELNALGVYLRAALHMKECDHTTRHTEEWLQSQGIQSRKSVLAELRNRGGYCDCEVLSDVVCG